MLNWERSTREVSRGGWEGRIKIGVGWEQLQHRGRETGVDIGPLRGKTNVREKKTEPDVAAVVGLKE